jgi:hypothetical protein
MHGYVVIAGEYIPVAPQGEPGSQNLLFLYNMAAT